MAGANSEMVVMIFIFNDGACTFANIDVIVGSEGTKPLLPQLGPDFRPSGPEKTKWPSRGQFIFYGPVKLKHLFNLFGKFNQKNDQAKRGLIDD